MQLREVTTCLLACVAFACGGGGASEDAQETIILRVAHNGSEQHPHNAGFDHGRGGHTDDCNRGDQFVRQDIAPQTPVNDADLGIDLIFHGISTASAAPTRIPDR